MRKELLQYMRNNQESVWMLQTKRADFNAIAARFHISPVTARIIRNRDVEGEKAIDRYLNGTLDQLYDPHLMKVRIRQRPGP